MPVPSIYDEGAVVTGTGNITVSWPLHGTNFYGILIVQTSNETITWPDGWTEIGQIGTGTAATAGSVRGGIAYKLSTSGSMPDVTITDTGDHTTARIVSIRDGVTSGNPINWVTTATVDSASATVSVSCATSTVNNCFVFGISFGAIDATGFQGGSNWTNGSLTGAGFAGWFNEATGTGGGYQAGSGDKVTAGSCGTFSGDDWTSATKQANIAFAISDTATVSTPTVSSRPPIYPSSFPRKAAAALCVAAMVAPFTAALTAAAAPEMSWSPEYPDRVPAASRVVNTGGAFAPDQLPEIETDFLWAPSYPDRAPGPRPRPHGGLTEPPSDTNAGPLCWKGSQPDRAPGPSRVVNTGGAFAPDFVTSDPVADLNWRPQFDDFARAPRRPVNTGGQFAPEFTVSDPISDLPTWPPSYPDIAPGHLPRPTGGLYEPPSDTNAGPLCWRGEFPDFARAPRRPVNQGGAFAPDFLTADPVSDLPTWLGHYPDFARGPRPRLPGGMVQPPYDTSSPTTDPLTWQGRYPDFAPGGRRAALVGGFVAPDFQTADPVADLPAWIGSYPDRAPGNRPRPAGGLTEPPSDTNAGPLYWAPSYPDAVPGPRRAPRGGIVETLQDDEAPLLSWSPSYPNQHSRLWNWRVWGDGAVRVDLVAEAPTGWWSAQPYVFRGRLRPRGGLVDPTWTAIISTTSDPSPSYVSLNASRSKVSLTVSHSACTTDTSSVVAVTAAESFSVIATRTSEAKLVSYEIKAGDTDPVIQATLQDQNQSAVNLTGSTVTFRFRRRGTLSWTSGSATIVSAAAGTVSYRFTSGQTDTAGTYESEWRVTTSGNVRSFPSHEYSLFYIWS